MRVHPRVCGGNDNHVITPQQLGGTSPRVRGNNLLQLRETENAGTSPRVRGKRLGEQAVLADLRYIPACAGETKIPPLAHCAMGVHPRVCGGNERAYQNGEIGEGTSPRVRGNMPLVITPRGTYGTSPRVRGKQCNHPRILTTPRYIPACAGETRSLYASPWTFGVHPRVCGGNSYCHSSPSTTAGTSPRVRGKHQIRLGLVIS